jgi:hypothetical protein
MVLGCGCGKIWRHAWTDVNPAVIYFDAFRYEIE